MSQRTRVITLHLERSQPLGGPAPRGRTPNPALVGGEPPTNPHAEPIPPQPLIARN